MKQRGRRKMTKQNGKRILLFLAIVGYAIAGFQSTGVSSKNGNDWENPEMIAQNKEPAHNTLMPYLDKEAAIRCDRFQSEFLQSLNGNWKFHWPQPFLREWPIPPWFFRFFALQLDSFIQETTGIFKLIYEIVTLKVQMKGVFDNLSTLCL